MKPSNPTSGINCASQKFLRAKSGVNDSVSDAKQLVDYLRDLRAVVNLIPYNPRLESPYERPTDDAVNAFSQAPA